MTRLSTLVLPLVLYAPSACGPQVDEAEMPATTMTGAGSETSETTGVTQPTTQGDETNGTTETDGAAESTGGSSSGMCIYRCTVDEDCFIDGSDYDFICGEAGFCLPSCDGDDDCIAQISGWSFAPCESNEACPEGPCVVLADGTGGCGTTPGEFFDCASIDETQIEVTDIEGNLVTVCAATTARCEPVSDGSICESGIEPRPCPQAPCLEGFACGDDGVCRCETDGACSVFGEWSVCEADGSCGQAPCTNTAQCDARKPWDGVVPECI